MAAMIVGRLAADEESSAVAIATSARRLGPRSGPASAADLFLEGLVLRLLDGHATAAPVLRQAISQYLSEDRAGLADPRAHAITLRVLLDLFDQDTYNALNARQVELLRTAGELTVLPAALMTHEGAVSPLVTSNRPRTSLSSPRRSPPRPAHHRTGPSRPISPRVADNKNSQPSSRDPPSPTRPLVAKAARSPSHSSHLPSSTMAWASTTMRLGRVQRRWSTTTLECLAIFSTKRSRRPSAQETPTSPNQQQQSWSSARRWRAMRPDAAMRHASQRW